MLRAAALLLAAALPGACAAANNMAGHTTAEILAKCDKLPAEDSTKRFRGETIGFVTPWHPKGKTVALHQAAKFTYISPLWFHIEPNDMEGSDNTKWTVDVVPSSNAPEGKPDKEWAAALRAKGVKIIPTFAFYGWTRPQLATFLMSPDAGWAQHSCVRQIVNLCREYECEGLLLEWGPVPVNEFYDKLTPFLKRLKGTMTKFMEENQLMLSVHADPAHFGEKQFESMATIVQKYVLHTYNFTGPVMAHGPNAPLDWFHDMLDAWKLRTRTDADNLVLVTVNTFGREYRDEARVDVESYSPARGVLDMDGRETRWDLTGEQYTSLLKASERNKKLNLQHGYDFVFVIAKALNALTQLAAGLPRALCEVHDARR